MTSPHSALTTIRDRTALMWLSCLSSLSSTSSSSKVTRLALKRDFFGGAGVKDGSWSGRSTGSVKGQPRSYNVNPFFFFTNANGTLYPQWWQRPCLVPHPFPLLLHLPPLSSCRVSGPPWLQPGHQRSETAAALLGGLPQSLLAGGAATSFLKTQYDSLSTPGGKNFITYFTMQLCVYAPEIKLLTCALTPN